MPAKCISNRQDNCPELFLLLHLKTLGRSPLSSMRVSESFLISSMRLSETFSLSSVRILMDFSMMLVWETRGFFNEQVSFCLFLFFSLLWQSRKRFVRSPEKTKMCFPSLQSPHDSAAFYANPFAYEIYQSASSEAEGLARLLLPHLHRLGSPLRSESRR